MSTGLLETYDLFSVKLYENGQRHKLTRSKTRMFNTAKKQ